MEGQIAKLFLRYGHKSPDNPQLLPHCCREIIYVTKEKLAPKDDVSPKLTLDVIRRVQAIVGALLYYAHAVDNKLIVEISNIGTQQAADTE